MFLDEVQVLLWACDPGIACNLLPSIRVAMRRGWLLGWLLDQKGMDPFRNQTDRHNRICYVDSENEDEINVYQYHKI